MADFFNILFLFLLSTVKFLFVPFLSLLTYKYNVVLSIPVHIAGGLTGVYVFYFLSKEILILWGRLKQKYKIGKNKQHVIVNSNSRRIVKIKNRWGYIGLIDLTPPVISIPIGTFIAVRFYRSKQTLTFLLISVVLWSFSEHAIIYLLQKVFHTI